MLILKLIHKFKDFIGFLILINEFFYKWSDKQKYKNICKIKWIKIILRKIKPIIYRLIWF